MNDQSFITGVITDLSVSTKELFKNEYKQPTCLLETSITLDNCTVYKSSSMLDLSVGQEVGLVVNENRNEIITVVDKATYPVIKRKHKKAEFLTTLFLILSYLILLVLALKVTTETFSFFMISFCVLFLFTINKLDNDVLFNRGVKKRIEDFLNKKS
jgi:hypothetical protein